MLRRLLESLITLLIVVSIAFVMFRLLPGDPTVAILDPQADAETRQLLARELGLDRTWLEQYGVYLRQIVTGDLGRSFRNREPVMNALGEAFWNTFVLAVLSAIVSFTVGIVLGVALAWRRGTRFEAACITVAMFLRSMPPFWVGLLAIMVFAVNLRWLPFFGLRSVDAAMPQNLLSVYFSWDFLRHAILPVSVGSLYFMVVPMLLMRSSVLNTMGEDFVELARAKGLSEWAIRFRHVARNAIVPVATEGAAFIGWAMGGLVAIEVVYSWPGLGSLLIAATNWRDYPTAQGALLLICATTVALNLLMDLLYAYLDPRIEVQ